MNRDTFKTLVIRSAFTRRRSYEQFLYSLPFLTFSLSSEEISQLADSLSTLCYKPGECIFKQDDIADGMYFIESGFVQIIQKKNKEVNDHSEIASCDIYDTNDHEVQIKILKSGDFFGELALVNKTSRTASAYGYDNNIKDATICKLAFLNVEAFERLIGPCKDFIKYKIITYRNNVTC
jgi:cAMP-dependent protein kinase regulator